MIQNHLQWLRKKLKPTHPKIRKNVLNHYDRKKTHRGKTRSRCQLSRWIETISPKKERA